MVAAVQVAIARPLQVTLATQLSDAEFPLLLAQQSRNLVY